MMTGIPQLYVQHYRGFSYVDHCARTKRQLHTAPATLMPERFAIAVQWPDDPRPFLVHLRKPYFVAEVRRSGTSMLYVATLSTEHVRAIGEDISELLLSAHQYFTGALGVSSESTRFLKGNHGREFPRYLMAKTAKGAMYIVEPDHPSPLVEVKEPGPKSASKNNKPLSSRFDTVTQYRLAQMRKYYKQFTDRQRHGETAALVVPAV